MRTYDRAELRHLNDGERFRDYEYLAEEFPGPNEHVAEPRLPERTQRTARADARARRGGLLRRSLEWVAGVIQRAARRSTPHA
jgi:hypothetical protein